LDDFRNVSIVTDFTAKDLPKQNTAQEVYDFVVTELTAVIPGLSKEAGVAMYGRMNRWAAEAILARVYLNADVYVGTPAYDKVIPLTQDIIDGGKYALDPSYRTPFSVAAGPLDGGQSHEVIWAVPYDDVWRTGVVRRASPDRPPCRGPHEAGGGAPPDWPGGCSCRARHPGEAAGVRGHQPGQGHRDRRGPHARQYLSVRLV